MICVCACVCAHACICVNIVVGAEGVPEQGAHPACVGVDLFVLLCLVLQLCGVCVCA